jgi:hypothetical protein
MRLITALRRLAREILLEIERVTRLSPRGLAYAAVGTAAAILVAVWAFDATSMTMTDRPKIQRAGAGSW